MFYLRPDALPNREIVKQKYNFFHISASIPKRRETAITSWGADEDGDLKSPQGLWREIDAGESKEFSHILTAGFTTRGGLGQAGTWKGQAPVSSVGKRQLFKGEVHLDEGGRRSITGRNNDQGQFFFTDNCRLTTVNAKLLVRLRRSFARANWLSPSRFWTHIFAVVGIS